jgi:hypothetical protein
VSSRSFQNVKAGFMKTRNGVCSILLATSIISLLFPGSGTPVFAQTTPPDVTTRLSLAPRRIQSGAIVNATLVLNIPSGYHVNAHNPVSRFALPTKIEVEAPGGVRVGPVRYPRAVVRRLTFSEDRLGVYEKRAVIRFKVLVPRGLPAQRGKLKVHLTFQSCSDEVCFPPVTREVTVPFTLS